MLLNLKIRDFAIIDQADIDIPLGFTVVTGETGAGKSILIDALNVVLGGRASTDVIRAGCECATVEALFDISTQPMLQKRLEERELVGDDPSALLIRRVIGVKGRAKVLINDRLSTVATLAEVVRGLVDISGQHEHQSLMQVDHHLTILDNYCELHGLREQYENSYHAWQQCARELENHEKMFKEKQQKQEYLRFLIDEFTRIRPEENEDKKLEGERQTLLHAEKLQLGASLVEALLYGEDGSAFDKLGKASAEIETLARLDVRLAPSSQALLTMRRELQEVARDIQAYHGKIEADPGRLDAVENRLSELRRLCQKHGGDLSTVIERFSDLKSELANLENQQEAHSNLRQVVHTNFSNVVGLAQQLSDKRQQAAKKFAEAIVQELKELELDDAMFRVDFNNQPAITEKVVLSLHGLDEVEFVWSANRGEALKPLVKTASGGELSRLMLAVKRVSCKDDLVSLYVFDEVDAGIGGKVADTIGKKIQSVAEGHQALVITHLAPLAARAHNHLRVYKDIQGARTTSRLERLDNNLRIDEIARMIDGAKITGATREAAVAMLTRAQASVATTRAA